MDVKPGQFIKLFAYTGYIKDVYHSAGGSVVLDVLFAKDIARSNPSELWRLDEDDITTYPATWQEFMSEAKRIRTGQDEIMQRVLGSLGKEPSNA